MAFYEFLQRTSYFLFFLFSVISPRPKHKRFVTIRNPQNFIHSLEHIQKKGTIPKKIFWVHVSSAGEMEQIVPLARLFHEKENIFFFLTYYSPSCEPFLKYFPGCLSSCGLPIDCPSVYEKVLSVLSVERLWFVRYDVWPGLVYFAHQHGIPIDLMCATKNKTRGGLFSCINTLFKKKILENFKYIFTVSEADQSYFQTLVPNMSKDLTTSVSTFVSGDPKWFRAKERSTLNDKRKTDPHFDSFVEVLLNTKQSNGKKVLVFASPHKEEQEIALEFAKISTQALIIYVPHDVDEKSIVKLKKTLIYHEIKTQIYSDSLTEKHFHLKENLIIFDAVGFLPEIYGLADIAIVGGGFDGQIHNCLEPAARNIPIAIGPHFKRAEEVKNLVEKNGALSFESKEEIIYFLSDYCKNKDQKIQEKIIRLKRNLHNIFSNLPDTNKIIFNKIFEGKTSYECSNQTAHHQ